MDSSRQIENLLYTYAARIDAGDFEGVADLFREGAIFGPDGSESRGYQAVLELYRASTRIYPETGTPCTRHVTTNALIEVDENHHRGSCHSYFSVLQSLADFPLQTIIAGRYEDEFERIGGLWRFRARRMFPEQLGDLSRHLLFEL
jgi:hypothetical protein